MISLKKCSNGFTLIEILVSITVLAILTSIAIPSVSALLSRNQTKTAAILFQDNLRQARYESRTRSNSIVTFCALAASLNNKTDCDTAADPRRFENGWQWFVDTNSNGIYELAAGDELLGNTWEADFNELDIQLSEPIFRNQITYENGQAEILSSTSTQITPFVTFTDISGRTSTVYFDQTGRATVAHN